jgi:RNA polymerase sigma-70 factor (ECF subfamily)
VDEGADDEELAHRVGRGDHQAFHCLYDRHKRAVYARLTKIIGAVPDREDVLQQAFLSLYKALATFRGEATFKTFFHQITLNVAYDHLRRRSAKARAAEIDDQAIDELASSLPGPVDQSIAKERLRLLFTGLGRLPAKERMAIELIHVEGLSFEEAAEQLQVSVPTVRRRVRLGRARLARHLEGFQLALLLKLWRPA